MRLVRDNGICFGRELYAYVLTDAIRDQKVLKFMVDYNDVRPKFKSIESEQDLAKVSAAENKKHCFIRLESLRYLGMS